MSTVNTVEYSVLINGNPQGQITRQRGLPQGDPLSPYLYILCADVLSFLIASNAKKAKSEALKSEMES